MTHYSLLAAAQRLFEAIGIASDEAHIRKVDGIYEKGWQLQRRWIDERERPRVENLGALHPTRDSLWRSITDQRTMFNKIAIGIAKDLDD